MKKGKIETISGALFVSRSRNSTFSTLRGLKMATQTEEKIWDVSGKMALPKFDNFAKIDIFFSVQNGPKLGLAQPGCAIFTPKQLAILVFH